MADEIMIAVRPGMVYINGRRYMVRKGKTTAHASHPVVAEHPKLWAPLKVDYPAPGRPQPDGRQPAGGTASVVDNAAIRAWAAEQGIEVSRGKLPKALVDEYMAAHAT